MICDVAIVGGGPAGSTLASLLRKYDSSLDVVVLETERFPRDHIGESQLPATCSILNEMGVWDKVEAAGFPVKIGSTYRWGASDDLWNVNFLLGDYTEDCRPGTFTGQRAQTAFQVDRSIYDKILLDHARALGCRAFEETRVATVRAKGDKIDGLELSGAVNETIRAQYYVDASGVGAVLRKALGIGVDSPTSLRNIAFWDYWQNAEWAETVGNGGTRVQVLSLGWGWIWFIPVTATRTSIGLVLPAAYHKASGKRPETLYREAIASEPRVAGLIRSARCEGKFQTTTDWNFVADRLAGDNWFLVGDACGFADPILAAGMTLAQVSARKVAYTILEANRGQVPYEWLTTEYDRRHRRTIRHHISFAEYWYSANGRFSDLQEYCAEIARTAGLSLDAQSAFQWLGGGGFANDLINEDRSTAFGILSAKAVVGRLSSATAEWEIAKNNVFELNLAGTEPEPFAFYAEGRVVPAKSYRRSGKALPLVGHNTWLCEILERESDATRVGQSIWAYVSSRPQVFPTPEAGYRLGLEVLEALIADGWVQASVRPDRPMLKLLAESR